jgi:hypothetical protein
MSTPPPVPPATRSFLVTIESPSEEFAQKLLVEAYGALDESLHKWDFTQEGRGRWKCGLGVVDYDPRKLPTTTKHAPTLAATLNFIATEACRDAFNAKLTGQSGDFQPTISSEVFRTAVFAFAADPGEVALKVDALMERKKAAIIAAWADAARGVFDFSAA